MEFHGATQLMFRPATTPPAVEKAAAARLERESAAPLRVIGHHKGGAEKLQFSELLSAAKAAPEPTAPQVEKAEGRKQKANATPENGAAVPHSALRAPHFRDLPPEKLVHAKNLSETEKVQMASRQFEALMLRQILSEAQKPVIQSSLTNNSAAAAIYRDLVTSQLADQVSRSGALGLAQLFEQQLTPASADAAAGSPHPHD